MKVGDLVKLRKGRSYELDIGLILNIALFNGYNQATVRWNCGKVQYFYDDFLEVINASR